MFCLRLTILFTFVFLVTVFAQGNDGTRQQQQQQQQQHQQQQQQKQQQVSTPYQHQDAVDRLVESQNNFTKNLFSAIAVQQKGNIFFSPWSISVIFAMVLTGSGGNTLTQLSKALQLPENDPHISDAFSDIIKDFNADVTEYDLRTVNLAYVSHLMPLIQNYSDTIANLYHASIKNVDFNNNVAVSKEINYIVASETNNKIRDLIPADSLNSLTRLVLANSIYFKGEWENKFEEEFTQLEPFYISKSESVQVPIMNAQGRNYKYCYVKELDADQLSLDYKGGRLSMTFLLPVEEDQPLSVLEQNLKNFDIKKLDGCDKFPRSLVVKIPKFKLEEQYDLVEILRSMGVTDLFDGKADLSGVSGEKNLKVSSAIHKSFIEVDEKGSEAAAASGILIEFLSVSPTFSCTRPFLFFIRDKQSGVTLFQGRYSRPIAS